MMSIDEIIAEVTDVYYEKVGDITIGYVTFSDGSQMEISSDKIYTYPIKRTDGIAKNVSVYEAQMIDFRAFKHYLDNRHTR